MKKGIFITFILALVIATTITKNSTKDLDKEIFEKKESLRLLKEKYELVLLDFNYLSSPEKLMEYQSKYFDNELVPFEIKNIKKISFKNNSFILDEFSKQNDKVIK